MEDPAVYSRRMEDSDDGGRKSQQYIHNINKKVSHR